MTSIVPIQTSHSPLEINFFVIIENETKFNIYIVLISIQCIDVINIKFEEICFKNYSNN